MNFFQEIYKNKIYPDFSLHVNIEDDHESNENVKIFDVHRCFLALNSKYFSQSLIQVQNDTKLKISMFKNELLIFEKYIIPCLYNFHNYAIDEILLPNENELKRKFENLIKNKYIIKSNDIPTPNRLSFLNETNNSSLVSERGFEKIHSQIEEDALKQSPIRGNDSFDQGNLVSELTESTKNIINQSIQDEKNRSNIEFCIEIFNNRIEFLQLWSLAEFFSISQILDYLRKQKIGYYTALLFLIAYSYRNLLSKPYPDSLLQRLLDIVSVNIINFSPKDFSFLNDDGLFLQILERCDYFFSQGIRAQDQISNKVDTFTSKIVYEWLQQNFNNFNELQRFKKYIVPDDDSSLFLYRIGIDCSDYILKNISNPTFSLDHLQYIPINDLITLLSDRRICASEEKILQIVIFYADKLDKEILNDDKIIEKLLGTVYVEYVGNKLWEILLQKEYFRGDIVKNFWNRWLSFRNKNPDINVHETRYHRFQKIYNSEELNINNSNLNTNSMEKIEENINQLNKSIEKEIDDIINNSFESNHISWRNEQPVSLESPSIRTYHQDDSEVSLLEIVSKTGNIISEYSASLPSFFRNKEKTHLNNINHQIPNFLKDNLDLSDFKNSPILKKTNRNVQFKDIPTNYNSNFVDNHVEPSTINDSQNKHPTLENKSIVTQVQFNPFISIGNGSMKIGRLRLEYVDSSIHSQGFSLKVKSHKIDSIAHIQILFSNIIESFKCTIAQIILLKSNQLFSLSSKYYISNVDYIIISLEHLSSRSFRDIVKLIDSGSSEKVKETSSFTLNKKIKQSHAQRQQFLKQNSM